MKNVYRISFAVFICVFAGVGTIKAQTAGVVVPGPWPANWFGCPATSADALQIIFDPSMPFPCSVSDAALRITCGPVWGSPVFGQLGVEDINHQFWQSTSNPKWFTAISFGTTGSTTNLPTVLRSSEGDLVLSATTSSQVPPEGAPPPNASIHFGTTPNAPFGSSPTTPDQPHDIERMTLWQDGELALGTSGVFPTNENDMLHLYLPTDPIYNPISTPSSVPPNFYDAGQLMSIKLSYGEAPLPSGWMANDPLVKYARLGFDRSNQLSAFSRNEDLVLSTNSDPTPTAPLGVGDIIISNRRIGQSIRFGTTSNPSSPSAIVADTERMTIAPNGNVGIGTPNTTGYDRNMRCYNSGGTQAPLDMLHLYTNYALCAWPPPSNYPLKAAIMRFSQHNFEYSCGSSLCAVDPAYAQIGLESFGGTEDPYPRGGGSLSSISNINDFVIKVNAGDLIFTNWFSNPSGYIGGFHYDAQNQSRGGAIRFATSPYNPSNPNPDTLVRVVPTDIERLTITNLGDVGIGTPYPQHLGGTKQTLDINGAVQVEGPFFVGGTPASGSPSFIQAVSGSAGSLGNVLVSNGASSPPSWVNPSSFGWTILGNPETDSTTQFLGTTDNFPLIIRTDNTERMRITRSGLVGIGTANPDDLLNIHGLTNPALRISSGTGDEGTNFLQLGMQTVASPLLSTISSVNDFVLRTSPSTLSILDGDMILSSQRMSASIRFATTPEGDASPNGTIADLQAMVISGQGLVRIGPGNPSDVLDIDYQLNPFAGPQASAIRISSLNTTVRTGISGPFDPMSLFSVHGVGDIVTTVTSPYPSDMIYENRTVGGNMRWGLNMGSSGATSSELMTLTNIGLGIYTTNPTEALQLGDRFTFHVGSASRFMGDNIQVLGSGLYGTVISDQPSSRVFLENGAVGFNSFDQNFTYPTSGSNYDYQTIGQPAHTVIFLPNGNFGIGTETPAYTLDVAGTAHFSSDITADANLNVMGNTTLNGTLQANKGILLGGQTGNAGDVLLSSGNSTTPATWGSPHTLVGTVGWLLDGSNTGAGSALGLSDGNALVLQPNSDGPVLIGTSIMTSANQLPVADATFSLPTTVYPYKLYVEGGILAKEFVVFTHWSDFVFDKGYQLTPLPKLRDEIDTLGHLPGIPSAKDVATNGVQIGDVSSKLLQKIEELTLYVIDLNKQNEELKARVKALEESK